MSRPVLYYTVALFTGCFSAFGFLNGFFMGAVITASFLFTIFFTIERRFFIIVITFFIIGMMSFFLYFNTTFGKVNCIKVRINNKNYYGTYASFKGKNVLLIGNLKDVNLGQQFVVKGNFTRGVDYGKGIVGYFHVSSYEKCKSDIICKLYELKKYIYIRFRNKLDEDSTAEIMALCFGDTSYLTAKQNTEYRQLGVVHAVSVSGFHMAIIYKLLERFLGIYTAVFVSFVYVVFTGASAATVRSFIMIIIFKISQKLYKNYDALSSLSFTAMIILLIKPYYILDAGFILSCLATLGIVLFYKAIRKAFYKLPQRLNDSLSISFSAQILTVPYAGMAFNTFSTGFIAGNLILLPFYSAVVLAGNLALLSVWITPLFDIMCFILLQIMTAIKGAVYLLMEVTPEISSISLTDCIFMMGAFICYILYIHGFKKVLYIPCILFLCCVMQYYCFFPEIRFQYIEKTMTAVIKYREQSILICDSNSKKIINAVKQKNFITRTVIYDEDGITIRLDDNHIFTLPKEYADTDNKGKVLVFKNGKESFIFTDIKKEFIRNHNLQDNYDIIDLPVKKNGGSFTYNDQEAVTFYIAFNRTFSLKN